jgi:transposase
MFLGIDVSKATLDAALLVEMNAPKARHKVFQNTPEGHEHLHEAGHGVSLVNPALVRAFGQSQLKRTKTDKADAQLIARFCALHKPALWHPPAPEVRELQALVRRVEALEEMKQMEENRLEGASCGTVRASLLDHIAYLQSHIDTARRQIQEHIQSHPALQEQSRLLCSIPGIGEVTAAVILAEVGEFSHFQSARQVAAFAGLVPRLRESGSSVRGKPRLSKVGSPRLRKCLYFPAMTALRWNPLIKALGLRLSAQGKPKMLIIGAAMRKLLHLAYGVLKSGQPFDANFCSQTSVS